jgi:uncharacterized membrane protein
MNQSLWNKIAVVVGLFVGFAGIMHFAGPEFFNDIVPPWLPPSQSFWTYISGVAEIVIAVLLLLPSTRRLGALAAVWLFIGVYPANIYMAWDWRNEEIGRQLVAYGRLPFQFLFIWVALHIARANPDTSAPQAPGDVSLIK